MGSCRWALILVAAPASLFFFSSKKSPFGRKTKIPTFNTIALISLMCTMFNIFLLLVTIVTLSASQCTFRNGGKKFDVKEGEVTSVKADKVRVCEGGKLVKKAKEEVPQPFVIGCGGCLWYGRVVCDGNVVKDLYRWWFETKCSSGRMTPVGRSWGAVDADKRYRRP